MERGLLYQGVPAAKEKTMTADLKKLMKRFNVAANAHDEVADCLKEPENVAFHQGSALAFP